MLRKSVTDKLQEDARKPSFSKSLSLGKNWKSKSMRIIPEELVKSFPGAFEHRLVFSVRWGNSWQLWLERDDNGLFMVKEDWDMFVDDNLLGPNHTLFFTHEDTMYFQVRIFDKYEKEITLAPIKSEQVQPQPQNSFLETNTPSATAFAAYIWDELKKANEGTNRYRSGFSHIKNPEKYLLNPENPYFVKTLTKKNDVLYVAKAAIEKYRLKFAPANSPIPFILPAEIEPGFTKIYSGAPCFSGWSGLCRKHNLKTGDTVICELERTDGLVTAVRVHFVNE